MYDSNYEVIPPEQDKFMLRLMSFKTLPKFRIHWHGHTELLYIIEGESDIYVNGSDIHIKPGDIIAVNANELHRGSLKDGCGKYLCVMLPPAFFDAAGGDMGYVFQNLITGDSFPGKIIEEIFKESPNRYSVLAKAYALIAYLCENYCTAKMSKREFILHSRKHETFNTIIDYIEKNYTSPITTKDLAKMAHLSETYFCHLFKSCMNQSVSGYITELRIEHAKYLLSNSKMTVTEIASTLGYNDVNYFCRMFKRITGMSPGEYKKAKL